MILHIRHDFWQSAKKTTDKTSTCWQRYRCLEVKQFLPRAVSPEGSFHSSITKHINLVVTHQVLRDKQITARESSLIC